MNKIQDFIIKNLCIFDFIFSLPFVIHENLFCLGTSVMLDIIIPEIIMSTKSQIRLISYEIYFARSIPAVTIFFNMIFRIVFWRGINICFDYRCRRFKLINVFFVLRKEIPVDTFIISFRNCPPDTKKPPGAFFNMEMHHRICPVSKNKITILIFNVFKIHRVIFHAIFFIDLFKKQFRTFLECFRIAPFVIFFDLPFIHIYQ